MIKELLEEPEDRLKDFCVEGHVYEFIEKSSDTVLLNDVTKDTGERFEKIDFLKDVCYGAKQGDKFQYVNGRIKNIKIKEV